MFEIVVISGTFIAIIIGIGWFVYRRRRMDDSDFKFTQKKRHDPKMDEGSIIEDFDDIYKRELSQTILKDPKEATQVETATENVIESKTKQSEVSLDDDQATADEIIVIAFTIMASEEMWFSGNAINAALNDAGFEYGSSQFFHLTNTETESPKISVANVLSPGTLNPDDFAEMETPGLLMFGHFMGATNDLDLFDQLLDTAMQLADTLGGVLSDELRQPINDLKLKQMHDKIRGLKTV